MTQVERPELCDLQDMAVRVSDIYAERLGIERDAAWFIGKLAEETGEVVSAYLKRSGRGRGEASDQDLENELADLFGFLLLFSNWQGIDLGAAFRRKWGAHLEKSNSEPVS